MKLIQVLIVFIFLGSMRGFSQSPPAELGKPGGNPNVRICAPSRADLLNKKSPLIVVFSKKIKAVIPDSSFKNVKPNYIKSISILKDSNSTKKYGIAAQHGVIEITIKKRIIGIL